MGLNNKDYADSPVFVVRERHIYILLGIGIALMISGAVLGLVKETNTEQKLEAEFPDYKNKKQKYENAKREYEHMRDSLLNIIHERDFKKSK